MFEDATVQERGTINIYEARARGNESLERKKRNKICLHTMRARSAILCQFPDKTAGNDSRRASESPTVFLLSVKLSGIRAGRSQIRWKRRRARDAYTAEKLHPPCNTFAQRNAHIHTPHLRSFSFRVCNGFRFSAAITRRADESAMKTFETRYCSAD